MLFIYYIFLYIVWVSDLTIDMSDACWMRGKRFIFMRRVPSTVQLL